MSPAEATAAEATAVRSCRSCGGAPPRCFLSLGATPVANRLVQADSLDATDPVFPLDVGFCEQCALVQLTHVLPAADIFDGDYPYFSSFSDALVRHAEKHVVDLITSRGLGPQSLVVEVASNDGYLLKAFVERGVPVLGIEPTPGPAAAACAVGVATRQEFFGACLARQLVAEGQSGGRRHRQQRDGPRAGPQRLRRGAEDPARRRRRGRGREPRPRRAARQRRVRHGLPRALLLLLDDRGRGADASQRSARRRRRGVPGPARRNAALADATRRRPGTRIARLSRFGSTPSALPGSGASTGSPSSPTRCTNCRTSFARCWCR